MLLSSKRCAQVVALALVPALLTACAPGGNNRENGGMVVGAAAGGIIGNQVGRGKGNILATVAGVVVGGIVGSEIGRSLDQRDREYAQRAEMSALERGRTGQRTEWRNPDNGRYGEVIPLEPYRRGNQDCRDYTHKVFIDGRPQAMRGTACRNADGTWTNVS
jgi:surface antigen